MQQVHPIGLRLGVTQNWDFSKIQYQKNSSDRYWLYQLLVRREISGYGCFVLNSYYYSTKNESFNAVVVFYRYIQRGRISSYLARLVQGSSTLLAPPYIRLILARRISFIRPQSAFLGNRFLFRWTRQSRKTDMRLYRGGASKPLKPWRRNVELKKRRARWGFGGHTDTELNFFGPESFVHRRTFAYRLRRKLMERLFNNYQTNVHLYNVTQFLRLPRLTSITSYYTLRRYRRLLYWRDAIAITTITTRLNTSHLVAHMLSLGLERHETQRKQTTFLRMYKAVLDRSVSWAGIKRKPIDWRISVYGRLDANMRRQHTLFQVGMTSYQTLDVLNNYSFYTAKSKFSTASVRIWIRNLVHWRSKQTFSDE